MAGYAGEAGAGKGQVHRVGSRERHVAKLAITSCSRRRSACGDPWASCRRGSRSSAPGSMTRAMTRHISVCALVCVCARRGSLTSRLLNFKMQQ